MKINERLNLVVPVERADGSTAYVHSAPISREVFEANFLLISKTFTAIHAEGLGEVGGPGVASLMLKRVAASMDDAAVAQADALMKEIRRLTNVLMPTDKGWETVPFEEVVNRKSLDAEDIAEVTNGLVFFTVGWSMYPRKIRAQMLTGAAKIWGAELSSLNVTEYSASLPTLTGDASSGATARASSLPS